MNYDKKRVVITINGLHLHHIISMRHTRETNNIWIEIQNSIEYKTHRKLVFYDTCVNEHKHCSILSTPRTRTRTFIFYLFQQKE